MPSQEPPVDDKNDGVDLPSEETDGSRCPFPQLSGSPSSCSPTASVGGLGWEAALQAASHPSVPRLLAFPGSCWAVKPSSLGTWG